VPKFKSHSGMSKRVKVTGSGRLLREQAGRKSGASFASQPLRSSRKRRRLAGDVALSGADRRRARKMLGR
jgi:large subunit ribosomal protein L35